MSYSLSRSYTIVFGLTADPIHLGHEQAIINGVEHCHKLGLNIGQFLLMPVYQPNLIAGKKGPVANFEQRFAMCDLVAKRLSNKLNCSIGASSIEKECAEVSGVKNYSFNTVEFLAKNQKDLEEWIPASAGITDLLFMVSADHFQGRWPKFMKWFKWKELLNHTGLLINQRPGHKINLNFVQKLKQIKPEIYIVESNSSVNVSSSELRSGTNKVRQEKLSKDVFDYVLKNNLYLN